MALHPEKLRELADSLSEDQRRLLREGLAGGENLDVATLAATLQAAENQRILHDLAADQPDSFADSIAPRSDAGAPNGGTTDAGADGGTSHPPVEPPLTRW